MNETTYEIKDIPVHKIDDSGATQSRVRLDEDTIQAYAASMLDGDPFPAIIVYHDKEEDAVEKYWPADGLHRLMAAKRVGFNDIKCEVRTGTFRDALKHSLGANVNQGLRRTNGDKRCAVSKALADDEWSEWTVREIADLCGVSHTLVEKMRKEKDQMTEILATVAKPELTTTQQLPLAEAREADDEIANVLHAELADDMLDEADDTDAYEIELVEREVTPEAIKAKLQKSGTEVVSTNLRKEAISALGVLVRKLNALRIKHHCEDWLENIETAIEQVEDLPKDQLVVNGRVVLEPSSTSKDDDNNDEGWGAPDAEDDDNGGSGAPESNADAA